MADFIPDGTRAQLSDGALGVVRHDMGGENVPVYIDGKNTSLYPHDYTSVPRDQVTVLEESEEDED